MKSHLFSKLVIIILLSFVSCKNTTKESIDIRPEVLKDKIAGGWAGQTIACTYGGPTEFRFQGTMIQDYQPIPWNDH